MPFVAYAHLAAFKAKARVLRALLLKVTRVNRMQLLPGQSLLDPLEQLARLSGFKDYAEAVSSDAQRPESTIATDDLAPRLFSLLPTLTKEKAEEVIEKLKLPTPENLYPRARSAVPAEPTWTTPPKHFYRSAAGVVPEIDEAESKGSSNAEILGIADRITEHLGDFHDGLLFAISKVIWLAIAKPRYVLTMASGRPKLTKRAWPDLNNITFAELLNCPRPRHLGALHIRGYPTYEDDFQGTVRYEVDDLVGDAVESLREQSSSNMAEDLLAAAQKFTEDALTLYLMDLAKKAKGDHSVWSMLQRRPNKDTGLIRYKNTRKDFSLDEGHYEGPEEESLQLTRVHRPLPGGLVASILAYRSYNEYEEEFDIVEIELVVRTSSGDNVGFISGRAYCVPPEGASGWDFFCVADSLDQQAADMAHMLLRGRVSKNTVFDDGDLLHITGWEMAEAYQGQGLGAEAMFAYLHRANEIILNLSRVYLEISPYQFPRISNDIMPPQYVRAHRAAMAKLENYVEDLSLGDDLYGMTDGSVVEIYTAQVDAPRTPEEGEKLMTEYLTEMRKVCATNQNLLTENH